MMRVLLSMALIGCLDAAAARAEIAIENFKQFQSRFGLLAVSGDLGAQRIAYNGRDLGLEDWSISIDNVWGVEGADHDWAMLTVHFGGNACDPPKVLVKLMAETVALTKRMARCAGEPIDLRLFLDAIELDFLDRDITVARQTYRYDGVALSRTPVAIAAAPAARAGADVLRWVGQHPYKLSQDASEQARFEQIMTPTQFARFAAKLEGLGQLVEQRGDWVTGAACVKHDCGSSAAAWALRISDGLAIAVIYHGDGRIEVFGKDLPHADPLVWQLMHERP